jgi:hypothetical protein
MPLDRSSAGANRRGVIGWSCVIGGGCTERGAIGGPEYHRAGRGGVAAKLHYAAQYADPATVSVAAYARADD